MSTTIRSGSEPSSITVFQWRLSRWYPGRIAACAARSPTATSGSHLRLTRSDSAALPRRLSAKTFPPTLKVVRSGAREKGRPSRAPGSARHAARRSSAVIAANDPRRAPAGPLRRVDPVRVRARALAGVERLDRGHLVAAEVEVEDVEVLLDA